MRGSAFTLGRLVDRTRAVALAIGVAASLAQPSFAREAPQKTFASPEAASDALYRALEKHDELAIVAILGGGGDLVSVGDKSLDKLEREHVARKYREMRRLVAEGDGRSVLFIGAENWPFPIPIVAQNGVWRFDAEEGRNEVLARRVGENEIAAIATCHALVAAEARHGSEPPADAAASDALALLATLRDGESSAPIHGYRFRMLRGGAFIAFPAAYRSSGVMTFLIGADEVVYEKDLGASTAELARSISDESLDPTWVVSTP